jgi:hypothetical protein
VRVPKKSSKTKSPAKMARATGERPIIKPGYHLRPIAKGVLGDPSKIVEELEEFMDAVEQGVKIMALVELSDLVGAVDAYLQKHHAGTSFEDLLKMRDVTKRAFENGRRS